MVELLQYQTSLSLLVSYEMLAREYRQFLRKPNFKNHLNLKENGDSRSPYNINNCHFTFGLLMLNASILEGIIKATLAEKIIEDIDKMSSPSEQLALYNTLETFELLKTWKHLKGCYKKHHTKTLENLVDKDDESGIKTLIALRNKLAHGSRIVQPIEKMPQKKKGVYPYEWQRKLLGANKYLKRHFNGEDLFHSLSHKGVPNHFMLLTKRYVSSFEKRMRPLPSFVFRTVSKIDDYEVGSRNDFF